MFLKKGDCCLPDMQKGQCHECICYEDSPYDSSCDLAYIGDGYCDDSNNLPGCAYDEGITYRQLSQEVLERY